MSAVPARTTQLRDRAHNDQYFSHMPSSGAAGGLVGALDDGDRASLLALGALRRYRRGATLVLEGGRSDQVFVLVDGSVKVVSATPDGRELLLAIRGPGEVIGELAVLDGGTSPRSAGVQALDAVEARVIPGPAFLRYLEEHPRVLLLLVRGLIGRLREADRRRVEFGSFDTLNRVARLLAEMAQADGRPTDEGVVLGQSLSQEELASMISASRESVTRALAALRRRGLIITRRKSVIVTDVAALRAFGA